MHCVNELNFIIGFNFSSFENFVKKDLKFFVYGYSEWLFSFIFRSQSDTQNNKGSANEATKTDSTNTFTFKAGLSPSKKNFLFATSKAL